MEDLRIFSLGGLDENGKNLYVIEIDQNIYVVECGIGYPGSGSYLGVDFSIPDFTYLIENKDRVKGIFISHAHDDVMNALPFLLKEADFPVYATTLTAKLLEASFEKSGIRGKKVNIISRKQSFTVDGRKIRSFPLSQSIADGIGLAFETSMGYIVYTSDFLFDYETTHKGFDIDVTELADIGKEGVFVWMSESSGVFNEGYTSPNHKITSLIEPYIEKSGSRIIITLYQQNLYRTIEILDLAIKYRKRVFFQNDYNLNILKAVESLGYYSFPASLLVRKADFDNNDEDIIVIVSGGGKKVFETMNAIATGADRTISLRTSDQIIIASPVVAGGEKSAGEMEDNLYRLGCSIRKINSKEVLSMHASIEDIRMMMYLLKPNYYLPTSGEYRYLLENANIALSMNYRPDKIILLDNGQVAYFHDGKIKSTKQVITLNESLIGGRDMIDSGSTIITDRKTLSTDGIIVVGVLLDFKSKELIGGPDAQSRGVIYLKDSDYILENVAKILLESISEAVEGGYYDNMQVRTVARDRISRYIAKETGKHPMILPSIVEINI